MRRPAGTSAMGAALWIDKHVGPLLCALLVLAKRLSGGARERPDPSAVRRILLVKMWGMGSIVLATPLLRELRARHPEARIDVATLAENDGILRCIPSVDRTLTLSLSDGIPRFLASALRLLRDIRRERYDLLLDLEFFTRFTALFSHLARARFSSGFSAKGSLRGRLHDSEVPFNSYHHVVLNFLSLIAASPVEPLPSLDIDGAHVLPPLAPGEAAKASIERKLAAHPAFQGGRPLVVVNPNAGDLALERRWPEERFVEVLRSLCDRETVDVVLTGAPGERAYVEQLIGAAGLEGRCVCVAGEIDVPELVALLRRADVLVSSDSGPLHVGAGAGASAVALFGPETPVLYGPLRSRDGQRHVVHYRRLACSPCMFVHDNKALSCWFARAECMQGIAADDVLASVEKLLGGARRR